MPYRAFTTLVLKHRCYTLPLLYGLGAPRAPSLLTASLSRNYASVSSMWLAEPRSWDNWFLKYHPEEINIWQTARTV